MILVSEKMTPQNKLYEIKSVPYNKTHWVAAKICLNHLGPI